MGKKFESNKKYYFSKEKLIEDLNKPYFIDERLPDWVLYCDKKRVYFDDIHNTGAYGKVLCENLQLSVAYYIFPEWCIGEEC